MPKKNRNARPWTAGQGVMRHGRRIKAGFVSLRNTPGIIRTDTWQRSVANARVCVYAVPCAYVPTYKKKEPPRDAPAGVLKPNLYLKEEEKF